MRKLNQIMEVFMGELLNLIIGLASGAVGGNIAGAAAPDKSLGTLGNTVSGILGGGLGNFLLQAAGILSQVAAATHTPEAAGSAAGGFDLAHILGTIGGGGVGGAVLTLIAGLIKNALDKK
jgi:uncharacterized membrane protein YeaQ/YmgE (transglycosylase-associated protein family)